MNFQCEDEEINVDVLAALSKEEDTKGFDIEAGQSWHYPTNYPLRDYQYNIVQQALYKNTLVSLPTGLGKTFIAAVVMYNFYRWYPSGKIIFMAPTRPLVKQQVDACYNIMAIPKNVTEEITGSRLKANRKILWDEKRVFFITPQILQNDLEIIENLSDKVKCLVFDEAHRAKGNHAYCEVIRKLYPKNRYFRVLALSATPGSTIKDVYEIINNLLIAHLEVRTEESIDVASYVFHRSLQIVVVPLGRKLEEVKNAYLRVLDCYTRVLVQHNVISGNCNQLTKGKIFMTMKAFQENNKTNRGEMFYEIMRNLNICVTLYHAYELLIRHGLRGFLSFYEDHIGKPLLRGIQEIHDILQDIKSYLGPVPDVDPLPDGTVPDVPETVIFGHPKYYELGKILMDHFSVPENINSRVIIFCEYKESVMEAYTLLLKNRPIIQPKYFMGQGAMPQRIQMNVINAFRKGECNTLISTCIGEEGLDVGEVDLIVCFDINNKSPIRLVQRMGRTGRKRQGKVIAMVTEGKEQQTLKECLAEKQNLSSRIITSKELHNGLFKNNPRMVPEGVNPSCEKIHITITKCSSPVKKKKTNKKTEAVDNNFNKKKSLESDKEKPKTSRKRASKEEKNLSQSSSGGIKNEKAPKKNKLFKTNSSDKFKQCDLKNIFSKGLKKNSKTVISKVTGDDEIEKNYIHSPTINSTLVEELFSEISAFVTINKNDDHSCKICDNLFECSKLKKSDVQFPCDFDLENWTDMDENVIKSIDSNALSAFANSLNSIDYDVYNDFDMPDCLNFAPDRSWNNISVCDSSNSNRKSIKFEERTRKTTDIHLNHSNTPNNKQQIVSNDKRLLSANKSLFDNFKLTQLENSLQKQNKEKESNCADLDDFLDDTFNENLINVTLAHEKNKPNTSTAQLFNNIKKKDVLNKRKSLFCGVSTNSDDDFIFTKRRKDIKFEKVTSPNVNICSLYSKDALEFLLLKKFEDIWKSLNDLVSKGISRISKDSPNSSQETVIYDLDELLYGRETSPVLTGRVQSFKLRTQDKSRTECSTQASNSRETKNLVSDFSKFENISKMRTLAFDKNNSGSSSEFETKTKLKENDHQNKITNSKATAVEEEIENISILQDLDNICDISIFGLTISNFKQNIENTSDKSKLNSQLHKSDVFLKDVNTYNNKNIEENYVVTNFPGISQKENIDMNKLSPIISQFDKTTTQTLPNELSITQGIEYINKNKSKTVTSLLKKLKSEDFSDDFCFKERRCKQSPVTPEKGTCLRLPNSNRSPQVSFTNSKKNETKSPKINLMKGIRKLDSDSDDDFEQQPVKANTDWLSKKNVQKPGFVVNKGKQNKANNTSSEQNKFIKPTLPKQSAAKRPENFQRSTTDKKSKGKRKKKKSYNSSFIEKEAQLDSEEEASSDTTEGSDDDILEMSFVNDETQDLGNNTMMHAEYLKSVRSPTLNRGQFKIPKILPPHPDVFSQVPNTEDNSYLNDSFCDDSIRYLTQKQEMSVLELAEMQLEEERKNRKRKKSKEEHQQTKKRRIIVISSDESE